MTRRLIPSVLALACLTLVLPATASGAARAPAKRYIVLYSTTASLQSAHAALNRMNARIVRENRAVGVATVVTRTRGFARRVARTRALLSAALDRPIGRSPGARVARNSSGRRSRAVEREGAFQLAAGAGQASAEKHRRAPEAEPLSGLQWDMAMLNATPAGSYAVQQGSHDVLVGVMDTGIDGSHPDIAPNFDARRSRNFTVDIPLVDGDCATDPDGSCEDPADVDEDGHGTHVAGTIAAPLNGLGMAGVAPRAKLVNIRAGQDSGYFFLGPTIDAMTYAGEAGIDVVNMSFFTDPWLFNCAANPADSPAEQAEQRTIIEATHRALRFGRSHGVTFVAALGNEATDLGNPTVDVISPDFPPGTERVRTIDNSCLTEPTEGPGVVGVSSLGATGDKAYYSNYGVEQTDVSAPGGDRRQFPGTPLYNAPGTRILAPMPEQVARDVGAVDPVTGDPIDPLVVRDCQEGTCAYYQFLQGTSMASPHAAGVAALIVAAYGGDRGDGGFGLAPAKVQWILQRTATDHACPEPRLFHHPDPALPPDFDAFCDGGPRFNGFYGHGIVNALAAVGGGENGD
jgi:subtilisin family serine protease